MCKEGLVSYYVVFREVAERWRGEALSNTPSQKGKENRKKGKKQSPPRMSSSRISPTTQSIR